jgi:hypothetical protein
MNVVLSLRERVMRLELPLNLRLPNTLEAGRFIELRRVLTLSRSERTTLKDRPCLLALPADA